VSPAGALRLGCPWCGYRVIYDEASGWWVCASLACRWCCGDDSWLGEEEP
jgi:hypothetical protein